MPVSANQSQAEWLSDILAALGFSGGGVSPVTGQKVQGLAGDGVAPVGNPVWVAGWDGTLTRALKTDTGGRLQASGALPSATLGTLTTNGDTVTADYANLDVPGVTITLLGTWTGTVSYEISYDGTNFIAANGIRVDSVTGGYGASDTVNRSRTFGTGGALKFRVKATAAMTGTVSVTIVPTSAPCALNQLVTICNASQPMIGLNAQTDASSGSQGLSAGVIGFNGATWDRLRLAKTDGSAVGTVGVLASALHAWDGAGYSACKVDSTANPNLRVALFNAGAQAVIAAIGDAGSSQNALYTAARHQYYNGATWDQVRGANVFKSASLASATAETTIWTPAAGKKFRLMGFLLTLGTASTLTFKDNTAGTTLFTARGGVDLPIIFSPAMANGILSAAANNVLTVTRSVATTIEGVIYGTEE